MTIKLDLDLEQVNDLCNVCDNVPFDVNVIAGRLMVDGRSVMGVMGLCGKIVTIVPITTDDEAIKEFFSRIQPLGAYYED